MASRKSRLFYGTFCLLIFLIALVVTSIGLYVYFSRKVEERFSGRLWSIPSYIFSDSIIIYPGQKLDAEKFVKMLEMRLYRPADRAFKAPGEYLLRKDEVEVWFRQFNFPGKELPGGRVLFRFSKGMLKEIVSADGKSRAYYELEPAELARLYGSEKECRILVSISTVPSHLKNAVIAIEDRRFYSHGGVDVIGILRALWADIKAGKVVQGGSTITQQLVKNYFLEPERSLKRKLQEALISLVIEAKFTKDQILEMYLNEIYMGQRGGVAIHGMGEAARYYFGRNVEDLTLAEAATLAGMIKAPNYYNPHEHPDRARLRRDAVLNAMSELGMISQEQLKKALAEPLSTFSFHQPVKRAPYFVDTVIEQLKELYPPDVLAKNGLVIYTSLLPEMEVQAEVSLRTVLRELENKKVVPGEEGTLQAVLIALQPKTGAIRALVGGRDYATSTYNRVLYARRQPGSAIKPFVYVTALREGWTPSSWLDDEPLLLNVGGQIWKPQNYDRRFRGKVMLRDALEQSLNVPTVRLAMTVGLDKVVEMLRKFGFKSSVDPYPSLALGAFEVTPLELVAAYTAFANEGNQPFLVSVKEVFDSEGHREQRRHVEWSKVISPEEAFIITSILEGVVQRGTARGLRALGIDFPCAGKTGTTSDYRDSWFVGYTTDLVVLAWIGYDDNKATGLSGASGAMRIWAHFMREIRPFINPQPFYPPSGVIKVEICEASGALATPYCPSTREEYFIKGTEPSTQCPLHGSGLNLPFF